VVAVAGSTWKQTTFTVEERVALVRVALHGIARVEVCPFDGLLVDTARSLGTTVILRGLRAVSDFEYELQMASMNRRLVPEVDTLFLTPAEHYGFLSASLVREIAALGGDVGPFVHPAVASALVAKLRAGKR